MKSTLNRSRESQWKDVSYSDEETTSMTENKAVEFTRKELQSLNQSKIKRDLEKSRNSRNEGSVHQEYFHFKTRQTVEPDHNPNIIPKRSRATKIIQVEDSLDYWKRGKMQPLEKVQPNMTLGKIKQSLKNKKE